MAILSDNERIEIWSRLMRDLSRLGFGDCSLTKAQLRTAINDTDAWINSNAASYNSALAAAAQSGLNASQKTLLFCYVALKRGGN